MPHRFVSTNMGMVELRLITKMEREKMTNEQGTKIAKWGFGILALLLLLWEVVCALWLPGMPTLSRLMKDGAAWQQAIAFTGTLGCGAIAAHFWWWQREPSAVTRQNVADAQEILTVLSSRARYMAISDIQREVDAAKRVLDRVIL